MTFNHWVEHHQLFWIAFIVIACAAVALYAYMSRSVKDAEAQMPELHDPPVLKRVSTDREASWPLARDFPPFDPDPAAEARALVEKRYGRRSA